mmetsp:Transcript_155074/g.497187  ORF Transcript_155074/g.497187 Transcript_155074/m.497187 type:complete len:516 (+) Transcript_155074:145-1692(+)
MRAAGAKPRRWARYVRRVTGGYVCAEGASYAHHSYANRRACEAPVPTAPPPTADAEYRDRFLEWARCVPGDSSTTLACEKFVRHAFFGTPPEALSREALATWLQCHLGLGGSSGASAAVPLGSAARPLETLMAALGSAAPAAACSSEPPASFVFREGPISAWYKPLPLKALIEVQHRVARRRLAVDGFVELRDAALPSVRYWVRGSIRDGETPLLVLHGYGRGLASPLFKEFLPQLARKVVVIVECPWLLVTRVPFADDITGTPSVREIARGVAGFLAKRFLAERGGAEESHEQVPAMEIDILGHSFGSAVASALVRELAGDGPERERCTLAVRRVVLMDPMCFMPGITKQAQLLQRPPKDLAIELLEEAVPGSPGPSCWEIFRYGFLRPDLCRSVDDEGAAARERRHWVLFQTYFFNCFIFRDLMYSWVNSRVLHGSEYLDRGHLRSLNRSGRMLTVLAETDLMIPAALLRDDLASEAPASAAGGVLWLPIVGHGACQHLPEVTERIRSFLSAS